MYISNQSEVHRWSFRLPYIYIENVSAKMNQYSGIRQKSKRRGRLANGTFEADYVSEPKRLRSMRLTDIAWENLATLAAQYQLTRSEVIEIFARDGGLD
jgi:hypothetical protein